MECSHSIDVGLGIPVFPYEDAFWRILWNLMNDGSMNWDQFKCSLCYLGLCGAVPASTSYIITRLPTRFKCQKNNYGMFLQMTGIRREHQFQRICHILGRKVNDSTS